jgi:ubiquinone/menaquinone biosynthesis C-methylase UbiE
MNCNWIAPWYWLFERAAFGGRLQRHRVCFLDAAEGKRRALILGDGDGRFSQALSLSYPDLEIDSIELSAGMVAEARKRAGTRVQITQGDVMRVSLSGSYDLIFTHFFLDCFDAESLEELVTRVSEVLTPDASWVVSDFRQARTGWRKVYTSVWLSVMYLFFGLATGLKTRRLPDYERVLAAAGFMTSQEKVSADGLIVSQWWRRQRSTG